MTAITSPAAQVIISVIPIAGIVTGGVVVFFYLLWKHRERSLIIKTGAPPRRINFRLLSFLIGILLVCVGAALSLIFLLVAGVSYTLLGGAVPLALGAGCLIFYRRCPEPPAG